MISTPMLLYPEPIPVDPAKPDPEVDLLSIADDTDNVAVAFVTTIPAPPFDDAGPTLTITGVRFLTDPTVMNSTPMDIAISIETVGADGNPTGTLVDASATVDFEHDAETALVAATFAVPFGVAIGTLVAVVIRHAETPGEPFAVVAFDGQIVALPYVRKTIDDGTTWTPDTRQIPIAFDYDIDDATGSVAPLGSFPFTEVAQVGTAMESLALHAGTIIPLAFKARVEGVWFRCAVGASQTMTLVLARVDALDVGEQILTMTTLEEWTLDADRIAQPGGGRGVVQFLATTPHDLEAGTYAVYVKSADGEVVGAGGFAFQGFTAMTGAPLPTSGDVVSKYFAVVSGTPVFYDGLADCGMILSRLGVLDLNTTGGVIPPGMPTMAGLERIEYMARLLAEGSEE